MRKRRRARELVLQSMYAFEVSGSTWPVLMEDVLKPSDLPEEVEHFGAALFHRTVNHKEALDSEIASMVENWEFKRIALIDRLVLRMALCEMLHFNEIPPKVTINEAIELAKVFSTEKSGRFVNGVLDALYKKLTESGRLKKRGRGLIG